MIKSELDVKGCRANVIVQGNINQLQKELSAIMTAFLQDGKGMDILINSIEEVMSKND